MESKYSSFVSSKNYDVSNRKRTPLTSESPKIRGNCCQGKLSREFAYWKVSVLLWDGLEKNYHRTYSVRNIMWLFDDLIFFEFFERLFEDWVMCPL